MLLLLTILLFIPGYIVTLMYVHLLEVNIFVTDKMGLQAFSNGVRAYIEHNLYNFLDQFHVHTSPAFLHFIDNDINRNVVIVAHCRLPDFVSYTRAQDIHFT